MKKTSETFAFPTSSGKSSRTRPKLLLPFLVAVLTALVAGHWLTVTLWHSLGHGSSAWIVLVIAFIAFGVLAVLLDRRRFHSHGRYDIWNVVSAGLLLLAGDNVAVGVHELLAHKATSPLWIVWLPLALFVLGVGGLTHLRRVFVTISSLAREIDSDGGAGEIRHMILPVSPPDWRPAWTNGKNVSRQATFSKDDGSQIVLSGVDLAEDIQRLDQLGRFNWQQMLRAIQPHAASLDSIWLMGSNGDADRLSTKELDEIAPPGNMIPRPHPERLGSMAFLKEAQEMIAPYLKDGAKVVLCKPESGTIDFAHTIPLQVAMRAIIKKIGANEREIVIDSTGGMKTTSIVGAVSTLNNECLFQYVDTRSKSKETKLHVFDKRIDGVPEV